MNALPRSWAACSVLLLSLGLAAAGCGDDKKADVDAGELDAGQKQILTGKLGAAVAAAESARAKPGDAKSDNGPPETGVFEPGAADKAVPPAGPFKVEVLGEGAEPRVQLAFAAPGDEQKATIVLVNRQMNSLQSFEYSLAIRVDKPKDEKAKDDKKDAKKTDAARGPLRVIAKVLACVPTADIRSQVPKEAIEALAKLKGSEVKYQLLDGVVSDFSYTVAKDADPAHEGTLRALGEALSLASVPLPNKPVGKGGFWMVGDRAASSGIDLVRYRVFRVESIEKGHAVLAVETRQYATKGDLDLPQAKGQKVSIDRFDSQGKGKVDWMESSFFPTQGDTSTRMQMALNVGGGAGPGAQRVMFQSEMAVKLVPAEAAKPDKKK